MLRHQLITLHRQVKKPRLTASDRLWFLLLASRLPHWKEALLIFQPETLLRWHRKGFRLFWKFKSRSRGGRPRLSTETIALIQQMARDNRLWGAPCTCGELLKLVIKVATATIQKYMPAGRPAQAPSQTWSVFLNNHARDVWACDFLPVIDLLFRPLYLSFVVELASRRVVHFGVTRHPTDAWLAQRLREATALGGRPAPMMLKNCYCPIVPRLISPSLIFQCGAACSRWTLQRGPLRLCPRPIRSRN